MAPRTIDKICPFPGNSAVSSPVTYNAFKYLTAIGRRNAIVNLVYLRGDKCDSPYHQTTSLPFVESCESYAPVLCVLETNGRWLSLIN